MNPIRRAVLRSLLFGGLLTGATGTGLYGMYAQAQALQITRQKRILAKLQKPLKLVFLTDLHHGPLISTERVQEWVKATMQEQPDLILLGGDYMDMMSSAGLEELLDALSQLKAPLGVYGVWGNHDYSSFRRHQIDREQTAQAFAEHGVRILRDEGVQVREDLYVGGVDDMWNSRPNAGAALVEAGEQATILLSHNPDLIPDLPMHTDLMLCGHTHGGQVRLPLLGAPVVPSDYGQRYAMGWFDAPHDSKVYVCRGLGVTTIPARNMCMPELAVMEWMTS